MNLDNTRMPIEKLRQEAQEGKTNCEDIVKRLYVAIETEYLKDSPDMDFINNCEDFLWEIGSQGQVFVSANGQYVEVIKKHLKKQPQKNRPTLGIAKRFAFVCVVFAFLVILSQSIAHIDWFSQSSSDDEQQYIIQGHSINVSMLAQSIAEHNEFDSIQTNSWNEFVDFLGFAPSIIDPALFAATEIQYIAFVEPEIIMITVQYNPLSDNPIAMTINYFLDTEVAHLAFEQEAEGTRFEINDIDVYCSENVERCLYTWLDRNVAYCISGKLNQDECIKIVRDLIGGTE